MLTKTVVRKTEDRLGRGSRALIRAFLLSLCLFHSTGKTFAASDSLITLSAEDLTQGTLSATTDASGALTGMEIRGLDSLSGPVEPPRRIPLSRLQRGAVLYETDGGIDIIRVTLGEGFSPTEGGRVSLSYTVNALTGRRVSVSLTVTRGPAGDWVLTKDGARVSHAAIDSGNVGVESIRWIQAGAANQIEDQGPDLLNPEKGRYETALAAVTGIREKHLPDAHEAQAVETATALRAL
jgi:hypothetical protein